MSARV